MNEDYLDKALIEAYGTWINEDLEVIKNKIAAVIAAHKCAGTVGSNPLCKLNRVLEEIKTKHE